MNSKALIHTFTYLLAPAVGGESVRLHTDGDARNCGILHRWVRAVSSTSFGSIFICVDSARKCVCHRLFLPIPRSKRFSHPSVTHCTQLPLINEGSQGALTSCGTCLIRVNRLHHHYLYARRMAKIAIIPGRAPLTSPFWLACTR